MNKFWINKKISDFSHQQWESLCDGCGKCCLEKLENNKGDVFFTSASCKYLHLKTCKCSVYKNRFATEPRCFDVSLKNINKWKWLPNTCSYRLILEGKDLPPWHHLICGDKNAVHAQNHSVKNKVISIKDITEDELENRIIDWIE